jgi:phosphoribosyl-ATP pyrophosphohydrolase/phosphoribosyl-AMP cyclohydrolase
VSDIEFLQTLEKIVIGRLENPPAGSYTAKLAAAGTKRIAQKVGEEGLELALAAVAGDREEMIDEAADLIYHTIVLLSSRGIRLTDVSERLRQRHSGAR